MQTNKIDELIREARSNNESSFKELYTRLHNKYGDEIKKILARYILCPDIETFIEQGLGKAITELGRPSGEDFFPFALKIIRKYVKQRVIEDMPSPFSLDREVGKEGEKHVSQKTLIPSAERYIEKVIEEEELRKKALKRTQELVSQIIEDYLLSGYTADITLKTGCNLADILTLLRIYTRIRNTLLPEEERKKLITTNRALVIEDDPIWIDQYKKILNKFGCTIIPAITGKEASNILNDNSIIREIKFIILDILLPNKRGDKPIQKIGEELLFIINKKWTNTPLLVASSLLNMAKTSQKPEEIYKLKRDWVEGNRGFVFFFLKDLSDIEILLPNLIALLLNRPGETELVFESGEKLIVTGNKAEWCGNSLDLTPSQYSILYLLAVFSPVDKEELCAFAGLQGGSLRVEISKLRNTLKKVNIPLSIKSERNTYLLESWES